MKYMKNVYNIGRLFNKLEDGRVNPRYKTGITIMPLLLGLLLRINSMNELKFMIKEREFSKAFPKWKRQPQIDTIRDTLKVILHNIITTAIRNKTFSKGTNDGYTVAAIDGTKFFGSNKKSCPECLISKQHHYHCGVVMSTIGDKPRHDETWSGFDKQR